MQPATYSPKPLSWMVGRLCVVAAMLSLAACGSSGPSTAAAEQLASKTRVQVARQYWSVLAAIYPDLGNYFLYSSVARGNFDACPGPTGWQRYRIVFTANPSDESIAFGPFRQQLEQSLRAKGWPAFAVSPTVYMPRSAATGEGTIPVYDGATVASSRAGDRLYIEQSFVGKDELNSADIVLDGPCLNLGAVVTKMIVESFEGDAYPSSELARRPVPTSPMPWQG